jgi:hypothetical protein
MVTKKLAARLILLVAGAYLACGIALALTTLLAGHREWWRALAAAASVAAMAAIMSATLLLYGLGRGPQASVSTVMSATTARLLSTIFGCVIAIVLGGIPAPRLILFSIAFYFVNLLSETVCAMQIVRVRPWEKGLAVS